jgi:2-polyprenyl-6-methoxyphenol hydroxylase-like FAD-dependent oxidoreductase
MVGNSHAVVIGAGIAGLCTARVLADTFDRVTVLDRDALPVEGIARPGAPQGRHVHAILVRGTSALRELFPGLVEDMVADGIVLGDVLADSRAYMGRYRLAPARSGLEVLGIARPNLEYRLRERVSRLPNVTVRAETVAEGWTLSPDRTLVTGLLLRADGRMDHQTLSADLTVDASGRRSRTPEWLVEAGYPAPGEQRIAINIAYSSCTFTIPADAIGTRLGLLVTPTPDNPRGGAISDLGNGHWLVSLSGYGSFHPPVSAAAFVDFARRLAVPDIYDALRQATATGTPVRYRIIEVVRRHYERLSRFPEQLVVLGDAVSSFNPVYGQGMSVAAEEALVLRRHLQRNGTQDFARLRRQFAKSSAAAWTMSVNSDLRMPWIPGKRPPTVRLGNAYLSLLHRAAHHDPHVAKAFMRVANLVDGPAGIVRPAVVGRVLLGIALHRYRLRREQRTIAAPPGASEASSGPREITP